MLVSDEQELRLKTARVQSPPSSKLASSNKLLAKEKNGGTPKTTKAANADNTSSEQQTLEKAWTR